MNSRSFISLIFVFFILVSCKDKIASTSEVYSNNFETNNLNNISGGVIETYNGTKVLGRYNKSGFALEVNDLPKHDVLSVSFDLYIHDSWDGNSESPDGPDMWEMFADDKMYISTTFSNFPCAANDFCKTQAYPNVYPNNYNKAKTGAALVNLPRGCKATFPNGTSLYRITKTFAHTRGTISIKCVDKLVQVGGSPQAQLCDESWSVDNIVIKAIKL